MKKYIVIFFMLVSALLQTQAYEPRNLLEKLTTESQLRQCLVMNQQWVPYPAYADRNGWNTLLGDNRDAIIRAGEKFIGYNWIVVKATDYLEYERSGSRDVMQIPNNKNAAAFSSLLMAELAEGKGRFIDDIVNGVLFFSEMTSWAESAHLSAYQKGKRAIPDYRDDVLELHQGGMAQMLSWTYYFLRQQMDRVDPAISLRLRHELQKRELDPYLQRDDFWWMATDYHDGVMVNNWNPWCNSNALLCFMLLENDRDVLARAVWKSMVSVDKYLNYVKSDGACEEGPSYWGHAPGKLLDYLSALKMITGDKISLFNHPQVRAMGEYIVRSYIGDEWVANFADASARASDMSTPLIYRYGMAVGSEPMKLMAADRAKAYPGSLPNNWMDLYDELEALRVQPLMAQERGGYRAPAFTWYPETQFCYMRNQDAFLAAKGGNNDESHNHNDVGTFILSFHNVPVMIDAGVGTYTRKTFSHDRYTIWTMQSAYHNLPMINGVTESYGARYKAKDVKADSRKFTFSADIAGAYPESAGVDSWVRAYRLSKNSLSISDTFILKEAKAANQVNFLTWGDVDASHEGKVTVSVKGVKVALVYDPSVFTAKVETVPLDDSRLSRVWGKRLYRLSLTAKNITKTGKYEYQILSVASSASAKKVGTQFIAQDVKQAQRQIDGALQTIAHSGKMLNPVTLNPDGTVYYCNYADWRSGFFPGSLWYLYELTGKKYWADQAAAFTESIQQAQNITNHHDIGFIINSSFGNGLRLENNPSYRDVMLKAARSLTTRFRPAAGVLQSWDVSGGSWQAKKGWQCPVIIDNMMNLELLFRATQLSGDSTFYRIAVSHADRTLREQFRPDGSCYHVVDYSLADGTVRHRQTAQGYSDESIWSRGQAWAIYGYTMCYRFTHNQRYLDQAIKTFRMMKSLPAMPADLIPYWDMQAPKIPDEPRDASSAAVIASALYELSTFDTANAKQYVSYADRIMQSLSSRQYMAAKGTNGHFLLMHSVGSIPHNAEVDKPLNYADYYFLEALARRKIIDN